MPFNFPEGLLICPVCANELTDVHCRCCQNEYFAFADIPCVFPAGLGQKALWQHQMVMMEEQGSLALANLDDILQGYDVSALTRDGATLCG